MAWLSGWSKRVKVTVSNTNIDSDLTHFPLLLTLGTSVGTGNDDVSFVFDELTSDDNRKKIAVTKTDGTTQLYCEIEKWDDANEKARLWVSKSDLVLSSAGTTDVYLYYDSSHADNTDYIGDIGGRTEVWDSHFKLVAHLKDDTTSTVKDSTSNGNDGTKVGANEPIEATGKIAKGQDFDGNNDYINFGGDSSLSLTQWTYEFYINPAGDTSGNWTGVLAKTADPDSTTGYGDGMLIGWYSSEVLHDFIDTDGTARYQRNFDADPVKGIWTHYAFSFDGTYLKCYKDINLEDTSSDFSAYTPRTDTEMDLILGVGWSVRTSGVYDEFRVSDEARSADWIKATYHCNNDNLISWGSEEEAPSAFTPRITII